VFVGVRRHTYIFDQRERERERGREREGGREHTRARTRERNVGRERGNIKREKTCAYVRAKMRYCHAFTHMMNT